MTTVWPKAIFFDMDDTILAHDHVSDASWLKVLTRHREAFGLTNPDLVREAIKKVAREFWTDPVRQRIGRLDLMMARRIIVHEALQMFDMDDQQLVHKIVEDYDITHTEAMYAIPGAIESVEEIRADGVKLVLITNGAAISQRRKIDRFALARLFDHVLIEGEFGIGKPDERVYRHALSLVNLSPEDVWMVGDNFEWEIVAPQKIGIRGVWVNHDGKSVPEDFGVKPYRIIKSLPDLRLGVL